MEILNMTFAGVPVGILIILVFLWYNGGHAWREWRKEREELKKFDANMKRFEDDYEWKPRMVNGVDCGEWVRKDGQPG